MALNSFKRNYLMPIQFEGLIKQATRHVIVTMENKSFQAINCTGTEPQSQQRENAQNKVAIVKNEMQKNTKPQLRPTGPSSHHNN